MQLVALPNDVWMIRDDFKSTLETIDAALDLLDQVPGRRIAVLGEISEPRGSQGPHYWRLGSRLGTIVSRAVIVGGKKSFQRYGSRAKAGGLPAEALIHARKVSQAVEAVLADLRPGDVVLVKGRDTQRLDRVALALQGRKVECEIEECTLKGVRCETCPMLERGWRVDQHSSGPGAMMDDTAMLAPRA